MSTREGAALAAMAAVLPDVPDPEPPDPEPPDPEPLPKGFSKMVPLEPLLTDGGERHTPCPRPRPTRTATTKRRAVMALGRVRRGRDGSRPGPHGGLPPVGPPGPRGPPGSADHPPGHWLGR